MTRAEKTSSFTFTGWHMLAIMIAFFGTIIAVNLLMAWFATSSWSGLVVENTYVASQQFNGRAAAARAMTATGIRGQLDVGADGRIRYALFDPQGAGVGIDRVVLRFKRPVGEHQDFVAVMAASGDGAFTGLHAMLPGQWIVEATSFRGERMIMHEAVRIVVAEAGQ